MGITQGQILLPSLNLSFGATSTVNIAFWVMFPEDWPFRRGRVLLESRVGGDPPELEPNLPHQGHALDAEKVLVLGYFLPTADVPPLIHGGTPGVGFLLSILRPGRERLASPSRRLRYFAATLKTLTP